LPGLAASAGPGYQRWHCSFDGPGFLGESRWQVSTAALAAGHRQFSR
jgi:hypothetical protein